MKAWELTTSYVVMSCYNVRRAQTMKRSKHTKGQTERGFSPLLYYYYFYFFILYWTKEKIYMLFQVFFFLLLFNDMG